MEILTHYDEYVGRFALAGSKVYRAYFKAHGKFSNRAFKTYTLAKEYQAKVVARYRKLQQAAVGL